VRNITRAFKVIIPLLKNVSHAVCHVRRVTCHVAQYSKFLDTWHLTLDTKENYVRYFRYRYG
jgi:hypothetical protein